MGVKIIPISPEYREGWDKVRWEIPDEIRWDVTSSVKVYPPVAWVIPRPDEDSQT